MKSILIRVRQNLNGNYDGKYPFFAVSNSDPKLFWLMICPAKRKGWSKAMFLGNCSYHPFQYQTEVPNKNLQKVDKTRVTLIFD